MRGFNQLTGSLHVLGGSPTHVATEESWSGPVARLLPGLMSKTVRKALGDGLPALKAEAEGRASITS